MILILLAFSFSSFLFFGTACLTSRRMQEEFERYGLSRFRATVGIFQLIGAAGLAIGVWYEWIAVISSAGLTVLMAMGVGVRVKIRDSFLQTAPALFYTILNGYLCIYWITER
jgi:hypothetical protein